MHFSGPYRPQMTTECKEQIKTALARPAFICMIDGANERHAVAAQHEMGKHAMSLQRSGIKQDCITSCCDM
jgi:hypothetical protein